MHIRWRLKIHATRKHIHQRNSTCIRRLLSCCSTIVCRSLCERSWNQRKRRNIPIRHILRESTLSVTARRWCNPYNSCSSRILRMQMLSQFIPFRFSMVKLVLQLLCAPTRSLNTMCLKIVHRYCHWTAESALSFFRLKAHCMRLFVRRANKRRINKRHKPNHPHPLRYFFFFCPGIWCFFFGLFIQPFHHLLVFFPSSLLGASRWILFYVFLRRFVIPTFPWQRHFLFWTFFPFLGSF